MICRQCGAVLSALFLLCMVFKSEIRVSKQYLRPVAPSIVTVRKTDFPLLSGHTNKGTGDSSGHFF